MFEVSKIFLWPAVRMTAALSFCVLFSATFIIVLIAGILECTTYYCDYTSLEELMFWMLVPVIGTIILTVAALIAIPVYNIITQHFGGIILNFRRIVNSPSDKEGEES